MSTLVEFFSTANINYFFSLYFPCKKQVRKKKKNKLLHSTQSPRHVSRCGEEGGRAIKAGMVIMAIAIGGGIDKVKKIINNHKSD